MILFFLYLYVQVYIASLFFFPIIFFFWLTHANRLYLRTLMREGGMYINSNYHNYSAFIIVKRHMLPQLNTLFECAAGFTDGLLHIESVYKVVQSKSEGVQVSLPSLENIVYISNYDGKYCEKQECNVFDDAMSVVNEYRQSDGLQTDELQTDELQTDELQIDGLQIDDIDELQTDDIDELRTDNIDELRTDDIDELQTDDIDELQTDDIDELQTNNYESQMNKINNDEYMKDDIKIDDNDDGNNDDGDNDDSDNDNGDNNGDDDTNNIPIIKKKIFIKRRNNENSELVIT